MLKENHGISEKKHLNKIDKVDGCFFLKTIRK